MRSARFASVALLLVTTACTGMPGDGGDEERTGQARVEVFVPLEGIPPNGECTHITSVRLADFATRNYVGVLDGAIFNAPKGETRITATAYPPPCGSEPADPPWIADEQIVFLVEGTNSLQLDFRPNVTVGVDPIFWDDVDPQLVVQAGSTVRTGRNFEDAAGPNYALDGWDVMQIALPLVGGGGTASTTMLFSTDGGALPYTPRGMARLSDGRFVFQVAESWEPLRVFGSAGNHQADWPIEVSPPFIQFDSTDGLERIDDTHLVRTAFLNTPLVCDDFEGPDCIQSAIEILEIRSGPSGNYAAVTQQILLPYPYNTEYPLGVTPAPNGRFVVSTLPSSDSRLLLLDATGAIVAGPVDVTGGAEGLFTNAAGGRMGILRYEGALAMYVTNTLVPRAGEVLSYALGIAVSNPFSLAWNGAGNNYVVLYGTNQLAFVNQSVTSASPTGIDTSGYIFLSSIDVDSDTNQLLGFDRIPPFDPGSGDRLATLDAYDLATGVLASSVQLEGVPANIRPRTLAYLGGGQVASHYRRPNNVADAALDATIFVHQLDGSLAAVINLAAWGVHRIVALNFMPATGEILLLGTDVDGVVRVMITSAGGTPLRSYRTDAVFSLTDMAPITSGSFAGQVGAVTGQPSSILRIAAP